MKASAKKWWWLLLALPLAIGAARLRFDVEVLDLLPNDLSVVEGLKLYQRHFSNARELIVTIRAPNAEAAEAAARTSAERLRAASELVEQVVWQPPWLEHPDQATELVGYLWYNEPPRVFADLANRLSPERLSEVVATTRSDLAVTMSPSDLARLSYDPFGLTHLPESLSQSTPSFVTGQEMFASADGTLRTMFIRARPSLQTYTECARWIEAIRAIIDSGVKPSGAGSSPVVFHYTGRPAYVAEIASGMRRDMSESVLFTAGIIAILFWIAHRRWTPMLWLLTLLALILAATLALGGLLFGAISVVSLGFAAILLGLAVDYGVVHYQEALASPRATIPEVRRAIGPAIFWAAVTTISAFLVLNLGGLPGLAQLGTLVAVGVGLSALVMLFAYLPPLFPERRRPRSQLAAELADRSLEVTLPTSAPILPEKLAIGITGAIILLTAVTLSFGLPSMDHSADVLRSRNSLADQALGEVKSLITHGQEPFWLITQGTNDTEIAARLDRATSLLDRAVSNRWIAEYTLPTALWPRSEFQKENRPLAHQLAAQRSSFHAAALAGGFATNALGLTDSVLDLWDHASSSDRMVWPTNELSRWILDRMVARAEGGWAVAGFVFPPPNGAPISPHATWLKDLSDTGFVLSGWDLLGEAVLERATARFWWVISPMVVLVLLSLWLAFRRPAEILLSLSVLLLSGLCLLAVMRLAGWSWNLLNLMALPLMLGAGVDYSIFMQLALRRHEGDTHAAYRSVGRALLLCGGTAVAGFGSLGTSEFGGMASLGQVCAVGIGCNMLISVFLLPLWWTRLRSTGLPHSLELSRARDSHAPSSLYSAKVWQLGMLLGRNLPPRLAELVSRCLGRLYCWAQPRRRQIVVKNLMPVMEGHRQAAELAARQLFQDFALKLADLWRYESGGKVARSPTEWSGWETFEAAEARGKGVLLVTPHLGNWELGGAFLVERGYKLLVVTQAEPEDRLTQVRQASRAQLGIQTLVIGKDAFAFVEIIKRLQQGSSVALLLDRPPPPTAVSVELFGRPFQASIAAAELARASGCAIVPVYIVRKDRGYSAHVLPEATYDRAALNNREARIQFTQEIIRLFEPVIRQHATQWYHFVPLWPEQAYGSLKSKNIDSRPALLA